MEDLARQDFGPEGCTILATFIEYVTAAREILESRPRIMYKHIELQKRLGWRLLRTPNVLNESLSKAMDNFLAREHPKGEQDQSERSQENRDIWLRCIQTNANIRRQFELRLSPSQLDSHRVLTEWVHTRVRAKDRTLQNNDIDRFFRVMLENGDSEMSRDQVFLTMTTLLLIEFSDLTAGPNPTSQSAQMLLSFRQAALLFSRYLRISKCLSPNTPDGHLSLAKQVGEEQIPNDLRACPWLKREEGPRSMPFYLWDISNCETRKVSDIVAENNQCPTYVAISHTWGRWAVQGEWVSVSGVEWKIPRNTKFDVQQLPTMLQKLKSRYGSLYPSWDYVWIDLLTIPQEKGEPAMAEVQRVEIGRQAVIFQGAAKVIAWFNDVKEWTTLETVVKWSCFSLLRVLDNSEAIESRLEETSKLANLPLEICNEMSDKRELTVLLPGAGHDRSSASTTQEFNYDPTMPGCLQPVYQFPKLQGFEPNPWFTSLWTVQEVYLRPDMWLANDKWEVLSLGELFPLTRVSRDIM